MHRQAPYFLAIASLIILICFRLQHVPSGHARLQVRQHQVTFNGAALDVTKVHLLTPPLRTAGRRILDANDRRIKLGSVTWNGASGAELVPMGLDIRHRREIATTIRRMGFNTVRLPYSNEIVIENPVVDPVHLSANLDLLDGYNATDALSYELFGPRALDVFKACVEAMTDAGIAVIINNHNTNARWRGGWNFCDASWKNDHFWPLCQIRQTTESWIVNWKTMMEPFVDNPLVIGADLRNEPRGLWGMMTWDSWATAAEKASEALLKMQPNWLMFVEGISSANDVSGTRQRPVRFSVPNKVVYSAHVYGWSGWSSFFMYTMRRYPAFALDMESRWGYLLRTDVAPVWVGEFGTKHQSNSFDLNYWNHLIRYLQETDADWGYGRLDQPTSTIRGNETDGLLMNDWETPFDDFRMTDLKRLMNGKVNVEAGYAG